MWLKLFAPAKINLFLRITGRRADGYHLLQSLMAPLSVGDDLVFEVIPRGLTLEIDHENHSIPLDDNSLLARAFYLGAELLNYSKGARIRLFKNLPIGAGLGGGSSDAAAILRALEKLTRRRISAQCYSEIANLLGADVPFFLQRGASYAEGIGEKLRKIDELPDLSVLLVYPQLEISTAQVYKDYAKHYPDLTATTSLDTEAPSCRKQADLLKTMTNDLESVVFSTHPQLAELKTELLRVGAEAALMSGSGSTVFGLFSQAATCSQAAQHFRNHDSYWIAEAKFLR